MVKENSIWHGVGLGIFLSIVISTIWGWIMLPQGYLFFIIVITFSYIPAGFLVAYLNPNHPFILATLVGIILSFLNQLVSIYFSPTILLFPLVLHIGILFGICTSLIGAMIADTIWKYRLKGWD